MLSAKNSFLMQPTESFDTTGAKIALILAGCGAQDGSEITEAVSLLISLSQMDYQVSIFAPDRSQYHTINHINSNAISEERNILTEAARIARGHIQPLKNLNFHNFDALVFSGGFGVAKNLCNFASAQDKAILHEDVQSILVPFLTHKKPVVALCIAPILLALACRYLNWQGMKITFGDGTATAAINAAQACGCTHIPTAVNQACIDQEFRVVTAPAYMYGDATPAQVFAAAVNAVKGLRQLLMIH